ncbi:MAG: alpha-L-fucosidase [Anaerolineae bacterium]|nr:alpha-L-fucosidase [Anaerolineae bacterium]
MRKWNSVGLSPLSPRGREGQGSEGKAKKHYLMNDTRKESRHAMSPHFEATWQSLSNYPAAQWFRDGKLGIFIHWGVYSVPAFADEWYPRRMYVQGTREFEHHVKTYGPHAQFGYKDFIPMFRAERFDPAAWAKLFREAGARYVVPVAEHHDGFAMYDSALSDWTAAKMGPRRDVIGELAAAVRQQGLVFGLSSHRAEHWWFFDGGTTFDSDVCDPRFAGLYGPAHRASPLNDTPEWESLDWQPRPDGKFLEDWLARCSELVDKYQPQMVYFDWWIQQTVFEPYRQRFAAYYYNRARDWDTGRQGVAISYKHRAFPESAAVFDVERGQLTDIRARPWQTCTSVSNSSWGYIAHHDYKSARSILHDLIDIVSKNGSLLLNIGPRPDGTIPDAEQAILREIGRWLAVNGEAIYGTRPWRTFGEGPTEVLGGGFTDTKRAAFTARDIRFTYKDDTLYAIALGEPKGDVHIRSLCAGAVNVGEVRQLGADGPITWRQDADGLRLTPAPVAPGAHAVAFAMRVSG